MKPLTLLHTVASRADPVAVVATLAAAAALVAVSLYAVRVLGTTAAPVAVPMLPAPPDVAAGARLFGAPPDDGRDAVRVLGVIAFDARRAAAIVGVGGNAARVVSRGAPIGATATLADVRARSIVVERNGLRREITLPAAGHADAFVR
ncbi:TPA: general secretion pathway protein GspC [Burkholderia vietnamiensis]|uniref:general secretion pathway protein GspC n=1 Tax=Burkholderia vietnamiensis TaxID=60552 RepID=UPI001CF1D176|nr:general secretion pathway protein GspC [Burkholderia vietnamiensis]MCA8267956.1 general secretion pathway protein GspC [Burkholderia vietnamiensis]UKV72899.1 general secretion pathway protein GspC [Burkholderia vietnamiensis]HDR8925588.1 general secretion pathway protein GspC [Burkholderia vietnamiensis]HDR9214061.1 general secretion pathway protein GspC [Burkholderia vietnamiensis]